MTRLRRADDPRRRVRPRTRSAARLLAWLVWLACSPWLAAAHPAQAREPELTLHWDAPGACDDREAIQRRVEDLLGRPLLIQSEHGLTARGTIAETEGGYTLVLETQDPQGSHRRNLSAPGCEALVEAAALVLALALDPERATPAQPTDLEPTQPTPTEPTEAEPTEAEPTQPAKPTPAQPTEEPNLSRPEPPTSRSEPPASRSEPRGPLGISVGAGAALDWGSLPSASPGVRGTLALTRSRIRLQLTGTWWPDRSIRQDDASAQVGLYALGASACVRAAGTVVSLWPCLGAEGGRMRAKGDEALLEREQHHPPWAAALIGLRTAWQAARWLTLDLSAGMAAAFTRPRFRVGEPGEDGSFVLHRPAPAAFRAALSSELTF